jgi:hypothetical protein
MLFLSPRERIAGEAEQASHDRFAAAALTGYLASATQRTPSGAAAAREAFDFAEAMMSERARRNSDGSYKPRAIASEEAAADEG